MPSAQRTIEISQPADQVFEFFSNPQNDQRWRPQVKEIKAQGPIAVGSTIRQVVAGPGGRGIQSDIEVTAYTPPTHYAFRVIAGPVRPVGEFRFVASDETTTVTFALTAELAGLKALVMSKAVQKSMDSEMAALDTARALLEA